MIAPIPPELRWLAATCVMTGLLWLPYVANRVRELGPPGWGWFPPPDPPQITRWADRAGRAHGNAVENLVVFAPLVLAVHAAGLANPATAAACQVYFWARLAHYGICVGGVPIAARTAAFLTGAGCQLFLGWTLLGT
jgi:uncharacterized MAPEG superfamily protein